MIRDERIPLSRLLGGDRPTTEQMVEALESRLTESERIPHQLTSSGPLVQQEGNDTQERGGGDGGILLAVTDRKLVFVVDTGLGIETADIPYTNVKAIETESAFLRTKLAVSVWGRGTFRLRPGRSDAVSDVVAFVSAAADAWQRAMAALQDARQHISELSSQFEAGALEAAVGAREAADDNIRRARRSAATADEPVGPAIEARVAAVEEELARARMEARLDRATLLGSDAATLAETRQYDEAHDTLDRARSHVETARRIADEQAFPEVDHIRSVRDDLDEQAAALGTKPLQRADDARSRAQSVSGSHEGVRAWEHALACTRTALTAGWGTDAFEGETDALREQVEQAVEEVIQRRRHLADRYESDGDTFRRHGHETLAVDRYETASAHLRAAAHLAAQYRSGDLSALRERFWWVVTKYRAH